MARIKLTQEGFGAFSGTGVSANPIHRANWLDDLNKTLTATRQGVALAEEAGGLVGEGLDFLTKAGAFGGKKTTEDIKKEAAEAERNRLMEEAAKKRAGIVQGQEEEQSRIEAMKKGASVPSEVTGIANEEARQKAALVEAKVAAERQRYSQPSPENVEATKKLQEQIDAVDKEIQTRIDYKNMQGEVPPSENIPVKAGEYEPAEIEALQKKKAELEAQKAQLLKAVPALEKDLRGYPRNLDQQLEVIRQQEAKQVAGQKLDTDKLVETAGFDRAKAIINSIFTKPETERTANEQAFVNAALKKYPELAKEASGMGAAEVGKKRSAGTAFQVSEGVVKPAEQYVADIQKRKDEIKQRIDMTVEEKKKALDNLDAAIETASEKKIPISQAIANAALAGKNPLFPVSQEPKTQAEANKARDDLSAQIAELTDEKKVQELMSNEQTRTDAVAASAKAVIAATAELQGYNAKRAQGGLSEDEAARVVQLQDFIRNNASKLQNVMQAKVDDPNFKSFVVEANKGVGEGKVPPPETPEERQARFKNALSMFDEEQKAAIEQKALEAGVKASDGLINADQLKLMAAASAINSDERMASKILGVLINGQVVGIQPQKFSDLFTGAHKDAFNQDIIKTLFLRAKGKSDEELAAIQTRLALQAANFESQYRARESQIGLREQELKEKTRTEEDRVAKIKSEAEIASSKATQEKWAASEDVLDAKLDKLKADADKGKIDVKNWNALQNSKMRLQDAMAKYYSGRNGTELAKARVGETASAILNTQKNFGESAQMVQKYADKEREGRKAFQKYDQYFDTDANGNVVRNDEAWNRDFPAKKVTGANGKEVDNPQYIKRVNELGGSTRGKDILDKLRVEAEGYKQELSAGKFVSNKTAGKQQSDYFKIATAINEASTQAAQIKRSAPNAFDILQKLTDRQQRLLALQSKIASAKNTDYGKNESIVADDIKKIIDETK